MKEGGLQGARELLDGVRRLAVLTGAGMSAESGVPTFRDAQTGLWSQFDAMQLASPGGFRADPALVWRWYAWRRELVAKAAPNEGHRALAQAQAGGRFESLQVVTQNVDGLHQRAGSADVVELHGNIVRSRCLAECGVAYAQPQDLPSGEPPRCPACGDWLRPDVVWFGEMPRAMDQIYAALQACDLFISIGTSGSVYPAAGFVAEARANGAHCVELNLEPSDVAGAFHLREPVGDAELREQLVEGEERGAQPPRGEARRRRRPRLEDL